MGGWTYVRVYGDANGPFAFAPWRDGRTRTERERDERGRSEGGTDADADGDGDGGRVGRAQGGRTDNRPVLIIERSGAAIDSSNA